VVLVWGIALGSHVVEGQAAGQGFTANNIRKLAASHSEPWKKDFMDKLVRLHEKSKKSKGCVPVSPDNDMENARFGGLPWGHT
jgi:hypothetical protein